MQKMKKIVEVSEQLEGELPEYVKIEGTKVETYSFFIRILHSHYVPCPKCQPEIKTIMVEGKLRWHPEHMQLALYQEIDNGKRHFSFGFGFVPKGVDIFEWEPCSDCQKVIADLFDNSSEFIIGNKDYEPPIELSRKFVTDDKAWRDLERRPATTDEKKQLKKNWWI